jgi:hypothetical protein
VVPNAFDGDRDRNLVAELKKCTQTCWLLVTSGHLALFLLFGDLGGCGIGSLLKRKNNARSDHGRGPAEGGRGLSAPVGRLRRGNTVRMWRTGLRATSQPEGTFFCGSKSSNRRLLILALPFDVFWLTAMQNHKFYFFVFS